MGQNEQIKIPYYPHVGVGHLLLAPISPLGGHPLLSLRHAYPRQHCELLRAASSEVAAAPESRSWVR